MRDAERFLGEIAPFKGLPPSILSKVVDSIKVKIYPKNEIIYQEKKLLNELYIIRKGRVILEKEGNIIDQLIEGDSFGYISLLTKNPVDHLARALDDTILFLLPEDVFQELLKEYTEFYEFYTKKLAQKLAEIIEKLHESNWKAFSEFSLDKIALRPPIVIDGEAIVSKIVKEMVEKNATSCLVRLGDEYGIITERDLLKKVLYKNLDPNKLKAKDIASYPLISLDKKALLSQAMLLMTQHRIRKIAVFEDEHPIGILEDTDIISHGSKNLISITKEIQRAPSLEELKRLFNYSFNSALELALREKDPELIGRYLAEIRDAFLQRVLELTEDRYPYFKDFEVMVIGAHARKEASFKTKLKLLLIVLEEIGADKTLSISHFLTDILRALGFDVETNYLTQPIWHKTLKHWQKEYENWILYPEIEKIGKIANFFDLRLLKGNSKKFEELRDLIFEKIQKSDKFLPYLALDAVKLKPPLGFFKELILEKTGPYKGKFNLFKTSILPIVCGVRVLVLENKVKNLNTFRRIAMLEKLGIIRSDTARDLLESYKFLTLLRLKHQAETIRQNKTIEEYLSPEKLDKHERTLLKEVLKFIESFQKIIFEKYRLNYLV